MATGLLRSACLHALMQDGCFADRSDLIEVHTQDDLAANQITAMRVGDGERTAVLAIAVALCCKSSLRSVL